MHSGFVPEMKNLDLASFREVLQKIDMIEKPVSKTLSGAWVILPGPAHNLFQVS